jgi:hypothetical protein
MTPDCTHWADETVLSELSAKQAHTPFVGHDAVAPLSQNGEKNASITQTSKDGEGANNGCGYPWSVPSVTFVPSLVRRRSPTHRGQAKRELEHAALPTLRTNSPLLDPPFVHPRAFSRNQQTPKHRVELVLWFLEAAAPCYTTILIIATLDE